MVRFLVRLAAVSVERAVGTPGRGGGEGVRIRDHLANVRTFLAWVRAGLILLALGYSVAKFQVLENQAGRDLGLFAAVAGWLVIVLGGVGFFRQRRAIETAEYSPSTFWNAGLSVLAALAGGAVLIYLLKA